MKLPLRIRVATIDIFNETERVPRARGVDEKGYTRARNVRFTRLKRARGFYHFKISP